MGGFLEKLTNYFTKRNTFKIVVIELIVIGLLMCALLSTSVNIDIRLNGDAQMTLEVGQTFVDPGATATADGREVSVSVSGTVNTQLPGTYTLCYKARYMLSSDKIYRTVTVVDRAMPSLELLGAQKITMNVGATYAEPGYRAVGVDGADLTARVEVSGTVDASKAGTYTLTYRLTDGDGRTVTVQRTVEVVTASLPQPVQPEGKVIYLTFDDGPCQYTAQLLEVLKRYGAKATFFVVNTNYSAKDETLKAIVADGHAIGIHSLTHNYPTIYANEDAFLNDLYAMQTRIRETTGVETWLMRFPGGSSNTIATSQLMTTLTHKVTELGFRYVDWNVDSQDVRDAKTADEVYNKVIAGIGSKKTAVVLQHDTKSYSVEAVEKILQWGIANGYRFEALTLESPLCQHR